MKNLDKIAKDKNISMTARIRIINIMVFLAAMKAGWIYSCESSRLRILMFLNYGFRVL